MGRAAQYIYIISGVYLLFYLTGMFEPSFTTNLLEIIVNPETFSFSHLWDLILDNIIVAGSVGAVTLGVLLATRSIELTVMTAVVPILWGMLTDILEVFKIVAAANQAIALILFAPYIVLLTITALDYWRGRD